MSKSLKPMRKTAPKSAQKVLPKASLGSSVKGADVASSLARRIARAAGIPESRVLAPRLDAAVAGQEA